MNGGISGRREMSIRVSLERSGIKDGLFPHSLRRALTPESQPPPPPTTLVPEIYTVGSHCFSFTITVIHTYIYVGA